MRVLALIAARGGSKRIPGKNIRSLGGKPLLAWSIDVVKDVPEVCEILLSTDDPEIAQVGRAYGASVPWLRPATLAGDRASSTDVCLHALDCHEAAHGAVDGILLLQPTSPFRSRESVVRGLAMFERSGGRSVIGVSPAASHPLWCYRMVGDSLQPFVNEAGLGLRSQDLPPAYVINGAFYLSTPERLRATRSFFADDVVPLVMESPAERLDIDAEDDWQAAEAMLARQPMLARQSTLARQSMLTRQSHPCAS